LLLVATARLSAADAVYFSSPERENARTKITGEIIELTGTEVRIRLPSGGERKFPAERIVEVATNRTAEQIAGSALLEDGDYQQALLKFRAALGDGKEKRAWVRREIVAQLVRCYHALGQIPGAGDTFLNLVRSDPATRLFDCIPLPWLPAQTSPELQAAAEKWLKAQDGDPAVTATARLLGASHLLATAQRGKGITELQRLAGNDDARIAALAKAQLWNAQLATASDDDVRNWRTAIERMPEPVRAGPYFVLGRSLARKQQFEQAATALLRVPILYSADRELAARSLVEAGACLEQLKQAREAGTLYREVLDKHRASAAAAEAQTRLAALIESAGESQ
jgi:tetratricopeptide (TPR) repeat protein